MEQKLLQAKAPLVLLLNCLTTPILVGAQFLYFLSLEPLGQVSTGKLCKQQR
jgi:hypothetical protein